MATEEAIQITSKEFLALMYDRKWSSALSYISPTSKLSEFEKKSLVSYQDAVGNTSLHLASRCQSKGNNSKEDKDKDKDNSDEGADGGAAPWTLTKVLLSLCGKDLLHKKDNYGRTPLHNACMHGASPKLIKAYLQMGKEGLLMEQDVAEGSTALHLLVDNVEKHEKPLEAIQLLVNVGGHRVKTVVNGNNETAYDVAVGKGVEDAVKKLVEPRSGGCLCF